MQAEWQGPSTQLPGKADVAREGGEADSDDEDGAHLAAQVPDSSPAEGRVSSDSLSLASIPAPCTSFGPSSRHVTGL